jgi:predicted glycogen debranching enzyme
MNITSLLQLSPRPKVKAPDDAPLEWLVANGLGGYASGSVDGPPMRRFHGPLVAALPAPLGRVLLVHALTEVVELDGSPARSLRPARDVDPPTAGTPEFSLEAGLPRWSFPIADGVRLERAVIVPHGQNTVHVRYRLSGGTLPASLRIRPWLDFRPHEGVVAPAPHLTYTASRVSAARYEVSCTDSPVVVRLQVAGELGAFQPEPQDWSNILLTIERDRGYDHVGSAHSPGAFTLRLMPGEEAFFTASAEPWAHLDVVPPDEAWAHELTRRQRLLDASHESLRAPDTFLLPLAADQFIVRPATRAVDDAAAYAVGAEPRTVIAGYPRFTDWGRDTMISFEGLALVTVSYSAADEILRTFALHVRHCLMPTLFLDGQRAAL